MQHWLPSRKISCSLPRRVDMTLWCQECYYQEWSAGVGGVGNVINLDPSYTHTIHYTLCNCPVATPIETSNIQHLITQSSDNPILLLIGSYVATGVLQDIWVPNDWSFCHQVCTYYYLADQNPVDIAQGFMCDLRDPSLYNDWSFCH